MRHKPKIFYGWWIVLAASLSYAAVMGFMYYTFGVFVVPLQQEFGWDRAQIYLVQSMWALVMACLGFGVGWVIDRFGARLLMVGGGVLTGLGLVGLSRISSLRDFYLSNFVIAVGASACSLIPAQAVVMKWFVRKRGLAIGVTLAGGGVAGFIAPQVVGYIIRAHGFRAAYVWLGIICWALILPASLLLMRRQPSDMGLFPDGIEPDSTGGSGSDVAKAEAAGLDVGEALTTVSFWILLFIYFGGSVAFNAVHPHLIPMLRDTGLDPVVAERAFGMTIGISVFFRFAGGAVADRVNEKMLSAVCSMLFAAAIIVLFASKSLGALYFVVPAWSVALGSSVPILPVLVAVCMGARSYGKIISFMMIGQVAGAALGPAFAGFIHKYAHSYQPALLVAAGLYVLTALVVFLLRDFSPRKGEEALASASPRA